VIKHEALALRRQRERLFAGGERAAELAPDSSAPGPEEEVAERERARRTAEALGQLKSSEIQCLLLKALGYSYDEIAARTGFSWTKVDCNERHV
jgi:DNA-directed RNA polymerase specialized sigma24 family protein